MQGHAPAQALPAGWRCIACSGGQPLGTGPLPDNFLLADADAYTPDLVCSMASQVWLIDRLPDCTGPMRCHSVYVLNIDLLVALQIEACDVVLGKIGYGTTSEVLATNTPLVFVRR